MASKSPPGLPPSATTSRGTRGRPAVPGADLIRVSIAPLPREDFALAASWLADPATNRLLTAEWRDRAVDATLVAVAARNRKNLFYGVAGDGTLCGLVAFSELELRDRSGMIWYVLGNRAFAGRGVTTSAVAQMCGIGFHELRLESIWAMVLTPNAASVRVLEKVGFRASGRLRRVERIGDEQIDRLYFDLLPAELSETAKGS
jgi:RimJ/RimL family protein N-acetyltransferase